MVEVTVFGTVEEAPKECGCGCGCGHAHSMQDAAEVLKETLIEKSGIW